MGIDPWFDENELLGGTEWEPAIRDAVKSCTHFIALLPNRATSVFASCNGSISLAITRSV